MMIPAGPEVRRMARELGIDLSQVTGSGPRNRIVPDDIKQHAKTMMSGANKSGAKSSSPSATLSHREGIPALQPPLPDFSRWGAVEEKPMTGIRRTTAEVTASSWQQIPYVTQHDLADVSGFKSLREEWHAVAAEAGAKLTMTALLLKVTAAALKVFPRFNCSVDMTRRKLIYKDYINLAVAVDAGHGLLTPVIFNADKKGVFLIASELQILADKAKAKKITIEEMSGSTFAVSNLGALGTTSFGPLVTWPHVAALGVAKADIRPVWQDDAFVPRTLLPLSVSYDHRANDGADAARFLRWICEGMTDPLKLIMEAG
jgi:pyruvate dehydrogenase E2 component (dihydrolipoamide acetyltransferase)